MYLQRLRMVIGEAGPLLGALLGALLLLGWAFLGFVSQ